MSKHSKSQPLNISLQFISTIKLPDDTRSLLNLYQVSTDPTLRICALAKIKNQILSNHQLYSSVSLSSIRQPYDCIQSLKSGNMRCFNGWVAQPHNLYTQVLLRFFKKSSKSKSTVNSEIHLLFHVCSLVIKYFFDEQQFKYLFSEITQLVQNHKDKLQLVIQFFAEVIDTVEYEWIEERQLTAKPKCIFQRYFAINHLNSMMTIANFLMEKAVCKDDQTIEDGLSEECYKLRVTEESIIPILQLLLKIFTFDFNGQKLGEESQFLQSSSIIIPTKALRQSTYTEFDKWLKNSEWIRIYQYLYWVSRSVKTKLLILDIYGDLSRIHMKYFKNKNYFKTHIQNIAFCFAQILDRLQLQRSSEESMQIAINLGINLLKLTSQSVVPIFFEINANITAALLDGIKRFLIHQVIDEEIVNVNVIFYFFKFLQKLATRAKFQKNTTPRDTVEERLRDICRHYQNYLRLTLNRVLKHQIPKISEAYHYRMDCNKIRDIFNNYDIQQLSIFFSPFKMMKPRYTTLNSVQELMVYLVAKGISVGYIVLRSLNILESYRLQNWEKDISISSIGQSIDKLSEWYSYTSYSRIKKAKQIKPSRRSSQHRALFAMKIQMKMEPIKEEYDQEIQNQQEYCHTLRVIAFIMLKAFHDKNAQFLNSINQNGDIYKLINLTLDLLFRSDLQQSDSHEDSPQTMMNMLQQTKQIYSLVCKLLLKQFQQRLKQMQMATQFRRNSKSYYRCAFDESQCQFSDHATIQDRLKIIDNIYQIFQTQLSPEYLQVLITIQFLLMYSTSLSMNHELALMLPIQSIGICYFYTRTISEMHVMLALLHQGEGILGRFVEHLMEYIRKYQFVAHDNGELQLYMRNLHMICGFKVQSADEAMNLMYLGLREMLEAMKSNVDMQITEQMFQFLKEVNSEVLAKSKDIEFRELSQQMMDVLQQYHKRQGQGKQMVIQQAPVPVVKQINATSHKKEITNSDSAKQNNKRSVNEPISSKKKKEQIQSKVLNIYNGYHRDNTMSIVNKYMDIEYEQLTPNIKGQLNQHNQTQNQFNSQNTNSHSYIHSYSHKMHDQEMQTDSFGKQQQNKDSHTKSRNSQSQKKSQQSINSKTINQDYHPLFNGHQQYNEKASIYQQLRYKQINKPPNSQKKLKFDNTETQQPQSQDDQCQLEEQYYAKQVQTPLHIEQIPKDYVQQINKIVQESEHHLGHSSYFPADSYEELEQINQEPTLEVVENQQCAYKDTIEDNPEDRTQQLQNQYELEPVVFDNVSMNKGDEHRQFQKQQLKTNVLLNNSLQTEIDKDDVQEMAEFNSQQQFVITNDSNMLDNGDQVTEQTGAIIRRSDQTGTIRSDQSVDQL